LRPNVQWDEEQLREHCTVHLAKYKQPRSFEVCKDLPRNFLGKVIRRELRETTDETATDSATNAETTNAETTNVADESVEVK
jgi:acyl-CoA synthetase (AMP-forming)/AMP-acid ligase II